MPQISFQVSIRTSTSLRNVQRTRAQTLYDEVNSLSLSLRPLGKVVRLNIWQPSSSVKNRGHVTCAKKILLPMRELCMCTGKERMSRNAR